MRQATYAFWKNFLSFVLAQFALGICAFFPLSLYLAVIIPGVWVLQRSSEIGIFSGRCLFPLVQCFVQQWIHALRQYFGGFGRTSHIFYVAADSNPEAFLLHSV